MLHSTNYLCLTVSTPLSRIYESVTVSFTALPMLDTLPRTEFAHAGLVGRTRLELVTFCISDKNSSIELPANFTPILPPTIFPVNPQFYSIIISRLATLPPKYLVVVKFYYSIVGHRSVINLKTGRQISLTFSFRSVIM